MFPHRLMSLNTWPLSAMGGAVKAVEPSGSGALLEEVCQWLWTLRFYCLVPLAVLSLLLDC